MRKILPLFILSLFILGADDCESPTPPPAPEPNFYCAPAIKDPKPGTVDHFLRVIEDVKNYITPQSAIKGGTPSTDRRSTVFVHTVGFGSCTGTVLGPHTVLSAAHCIGQDPWNVPDGQKFSIYTDITKPALATTGKYLKHPKYTRSDKSADLVLLYFDELLPEPWITGIYNPEWGSLCEDLLAQGWGQTEEDPIPCPDGSSYCLREAPYMVTEIANGGKTLISEHRQWGGICFGDSGGPLYAKVKGQLGYHLAGITSWTQTYDCLIASGHVNAFHYKDWIFANFEGPNTAGSFK